MPPALVLWLSLASFFVALAIGAALLFSHAYRRHVPLGAALPHGLFGGAGLLLLLIALVGGVGGTEGLGPWPIVALIALLVAAAMGVTMFVLHARTGAIPLRLGVAHGTAALIGVLILFLAVITRAWTGEPAIHGPPAPTATPAQPVP